MAILNKESHQANTKLARKWLTQVPKDAAQKTVANAFHDEIAKQIDWSVYTADHTPEGGLTFSRCCLADKTDDHPICIVAYAWPTQAQDAQGYKTRIHSHDAFCRFDIIAGNVQERFYQLTEKAVLDSNDAKLIHTPVTQLDAKRYQAGDVIIDLPEEQDPNKPYIHSLENCGTQLGITCHIYAVAFEHLLTDLNVYYPNELETISS